MELNNKERFDDKWLDAALNQYGRVEPRPGLENRVLANLRAERERAASPGWQWWPTGAALAAIVLMTMSVFVARLNRHKTKPPVAREIVVPVEVKGPEPSQMKRRAETGRILARMPQPCRDVEVEFVSEKREQFPSPEPLSEQEQMLARYVEQFPRQATLMAQMQTELTRQEMLEQSHSEVPTSLEVHNQ